MAKGQPGFSRDGKMPYQKLLEVMAHMALATESVAVLDSDSAWGPCCPRTSRAALRSLG